MSEWECLCIILSVLTIVCFCLYLRHVSEINIGSGCPPIKNITLAYKFKEGSYRGWEQVLMECRSIDPKVANIRVLYDDPKKEDGGRHAVGSILREGDSRRCEQLEQLEQRFTEAGFHVCSFPEVTHAVTASGPRGSPLSVLLGARRVYTRLQDYIKDRKLCAHPYVEVYSQGRVHYMVPLARQGDFYVPELRPSERRLSAGEATGSESDTSGVDSNSECSSGSGVLWTDSRDASVAGSEGRGWRDEDPRERGRTAGPSPAVRPGQGRGTRGEDPAGGTENPPDGKRGAAVGDGEE